MNQQGIYRGKDVGKMLSVINILEKRAYMHTLNSELCNSLIALDAMSIVLKETNAYPLFSVELFSLTILT